MKKSVLFLFLFFNLIDLFGQHIDETNLLYINALEKYSTQIDSFYVKYSTDSLQYDKIYLEREEYLSAIPTKINGRKIVMMDGENFEDVYESSNWNLIHLKIFPMKVEKEFLSIKFVPYHGYINEQEILNLRFGDWTIIYFEFDCGTKKWCYKYTENSGI